VDPCNTIVTVYSKEACPKSKRHWREKGSREEQNVHISHFLIWTVISFAICACCLCLCACVDRRRKRNLKKLQEEKEMLQFSNTTFDQNSTFVPLQQMEPQVYTMPPISENGMQFVTPPQYFFYPPVQNPISIPILEREGLLSNDEMLARQLQAQYDQEAR